MHDFDVGRAERYTRDREFKIGGETFIRRAAVRPEVTAAVDDLEPTEGATAMIEHLDALILAHLEPTNGQHDRYRALREREDDPITGGDLNELARWLIAENARRPTLQSVPSSDGPGQTGPTSTVISSTPPAEASAT